MDDFAFNIKASQELTIDQQLLLLYELRYKGELRAAAAKIQVLVGDQGKDFKNEVWNEHSQISMVNTAKYYIQYVLVKNFYDFVNGAPIISTTLLQRTPSLKTLLHTLCQSYASYWLLDELQSFYETLPPSGDHLTYFFLGGKKSRVELLQDQLK